MVRESQTSIVNLMLTFGQLVHFSRIQFSKSLFGLSLEKIPPNKQIDRCRRVQIGKRDGLGEQRHPQLFLRERKKAVG